MQSEIKHPLSNADSAPYWEAAAEHRLIFKKCLDCGHVQFPPRHLCPKCWSDKSQWIVSAGKGSVHSYSIVHRAPTAQFAARVPYVVAMIDLADGPRMMANIIGDGALQARIGDAVEVTYEEIDGVVMPQFRISKAG